MIEFFVHGEPRTKGSMKHVGKGRVINSSPKTKKWQTAVKVQARMHAPDEPLNCPVRVTAIFGMPRPQYHAKAKEAPVWAHMRGDLDKLCRCVGDALEQAGVLSNDARIVEWRTAKVYSGVPGVYVGVDEAQLADDEWAFDILEYGVKL